MIVCEAIRYGYICVSSVNDVHATTLQIRHHKTTIKSNVSGCYESPTCPLYTEDMAFSLEEWFDKNGN